MLVLNSPGIALKKIAESVKNHRIAHEFTQEELSQRAQVPLGTLRRFEQTGEIAFSTLIQILGVLHLLDQLVLALEFKPQPKSIREVEKMYLQAKRKRVRKKND